MIKKSKAQKEIDRKNALRLIDSLYFYNVITIGYENNIAKVKYQTIQEEIHKVLSKFEVYENEYAYYEHYIVFFLEIVLSYKQKKYDNENYLNNLSDANITRKQRLELDQIDKKYEMSFILAFIEIKNDKVDVQKLLEIIDDLFPKLTVMEYSFYEIRGLVKKYYSYCYETSSIDFYIYLIHLGIIKSEKVKIKKMDIDSFVQNNQYFLIRTFLLMEFEMIKNYLAASMRDPIEYEARKIIDTLDFLNELRKVKGFGSQLNITETVTGIAAKNIDGISIIKSDSYNCISKVSIFIEKYVSILSTPPFFINMVSQVIGYFGKALYLKYSKLEGENKNTVEEIAKKASSFLRNEKGLIISGKAIESNYQFTLHKEFRKVEYYVYNQQIKDQVCQETGLNVYDWKSPDYTYYGAYILDL